MYAAFYGHLDIVELLLEAGADIDAKKSVISYILIPIT
jgi:ankyrin repeat protein